MIVTTAKKALAEETEEAKRLAESWGLVFEPRRKRSFQQWLAQAGEPIYVVGDRGDKLYHPAAAKPLEFHPSMAWIRYQRLQKGGQDPIVEAMALNPGMTVLDTTMGLGSDSITASLAVKETGHVTAVEWNPYTAHLVGKGMQNWESSSNEFNQAMRRIEVRSGSSEKVLEQLAANRYDIVYMDPMFEEAVEDSPHMAPLRLFATHRQPGKKEVLEAVRAASCRVVIKTRTLPSFLQDLGFTWRKRSGSVFSYALYQKGEQS
ncbi:class I SAM-dependent methyltransferase [Salibacterium sp. K-3]